MSQYDSMSSKAQSLLATYKKNKIKQLINKNIFFSKKIDNYIPANFDFIKYRMYDKFAELNYSASMYENHANIINMIVDKYPDTFNETNKYWWIIKPNKPKGSIVLIFIARTEEEAFNNVMIRKAKFENWVPKIENNKIIGNVNLAIIAKVALKYDQQYGMLLKSIYDKQYPAINPLTNSQ